MSPAPTPQHPHHSSGTRPPTQHGTHPGGKKPQRPHINIFSPAATRTIVLSSVLSVLASLATTWLFLNVGELVERFVTQEPIPSALTLSIVLSALLAATCIAATLGITGTAAGREETHVRQRILRHVLALGPVDRTSKRSGALASTATDGAERVALFKMTFVGPMIASVISPILVLCVVGIVIDWFTALILLIAVPAIPVIVGGFQRAFRKVSSQSREERQKLAAEYLDALQGLTTLSLIGASTRTQHRLAQSGEKNRRSIMSLLAVNQLVILVLDGIFSLFMVAAVAWLAITRLSTGHIDLGQAVALLLISLVLLEPLNKVGEFFYLGLGGLAIQRGIRGFLSSRIAVTSGNHKLPNTFDHTQPLVQFNNAHFAYGELTILSGITLSINPGEHVAIIGPSGTGKSTIAALIQRNQPIADGQLILAGHDANTLTMRDARALSATVGQTTFLFTGTLRENLLIARHNATDEQLWNALETANLAHDIRAMPAALDTIVGERGYSLSGGQAQRLAIARALLTEAPLLILDEPTSQVDLANEALLLDALDKAAHNRTVLTIAHRPTTLRTVDRILRLENGTLTEVTR
ncbi:ABC transporter ATP-binding protein/permease [Timonella sp. A28]|uniref:ABC transporter ATP-binding protein/permease n=1 Tax=Timonella sp. A28 TaxID=3442640 RepID=UPI003EB83789